MRSYEFPITFKADKIDNVKIGISVGPSHTAQEFVDDNFIVEGIKKLTHALSVWKATEVQIDISTAGRRQLVVDLISSHFDANWLVAALLNLIDGAVSFQDIDDDPYVSGVEVIYPTERELSLDGVLENLGNFSEICRNKLSGFLDGGFSIEGVEQSEWPSQAEDYFFNLEFALSKPLNEAGSEEMKTLISALEYLISESTFDDVNGPDHYLEEGTDIIASEIQISDIVIEYRIETPPSDISIPMNIIYDVLARIAGQKMPPLRVEIRERW